jgi:hypothetical protein
MRRAEIDVRMERRGYEYRSQRSVRGRLERAMNSGVHHTQPSLTPASFGLVLALITIAALVILLLLGT